jgi:hypothetical protein
MLTLDTFQRTSSKEQGSFYISLEKTRVNMVYEKN